MSDQAVANGGVAAADYPARLAELKKSLRVLFGALPDTMGSFNSLHKESLRDGALPGATKELMALAIGICTHCEGCIAVHVNEALEAGATRPEIEETIGVAIMMGGGPAVVYGAEALTALGQFEAGDA